MSSLSVFVVDFDDDPQPLVGPAIAQAAMEARQNWPSIGYAMMTPDIYDHDPMKFRQAIYENQAWAGVMINPNATTMLRQAVLQGNASYDPKGACQVIYVEARDQTTIGSYIVPQLQRLETQVQATFGARWVQQIVTNASMRASPDTLAKVPQALNPAIGFSTFNLRPFAPVTATPAVSIGLIYLLIISFFSFAFFAPVHMGLVRPEGHPPVHVHHLIPWMWGASMLFYFVASCIYSLTSVAFQIPFWMDPEPGTTPANNATAFGRATFVVYWMINFWGMAALGLASENVAMILGMPYAACWLIFWVITNVSTSFYAIELSPGFFQWGYAWPLYNVVQASRQVLFDLHLSLGTHFGILIAWAVVGTMLFPFCVKFFLWKTKRAMMKQKQPGAVESKSAAVKRAWNSVGFGKRRARN